MLAVTHVRALEVGGGAAGAYARLADRIIANSFADRIFFCNSGTEANEGAIKFARKWGRSVDASGAKHRLVSFKGGFHGRSMGALSCTANPKYQQPFTPLLPGVDHVAVGDLDALRATITDATCGVFVEPIQGEGGVNVVPTPFLHEIRRLCDQHKALLIVDEVQSGLARTGKLWGHEWVGVTPDVMTLAKALGNGVPIGAICVTEAVGQGASAGAGCAERGSAETQERKGGRERFALPSRLPSSRRRWPLGSAGGRRARSSSLQPRRPRQHLCWSAARVPCRRGTPPRLPRSMCPPPTTTTTHLVG